MPEKEDKPAPERKGPTMTLALILTILWLAVMLLVVAACRMAAKGDRALHTAERASQHREDELLAPVERRVRMPQVRAYRVGTASAELQPAAFQHVGDRAQKDLDVRPQ